jgi:hypothetical protein
MRRPYFAVAQRLTLNGNKDEVAAWIDCISDPSAQTEVLLGIAEALLPPDGP